MAMGNELCHLLHVYPATDGFFHPKLEREEEQLATLWGALRSRIVDITLLRDSMGSVSLHSDFSKPVVHAKSSRVDCMADKECSFIFDIVTMLQVI